jgi:hypothetical protein
MAHCELQVSRVVCCEPMLSRQRQQRGQLAVVKRKVCLDRQAIEKGHEFDDRRRIDPVPPLGLQESVGQFYVPQCRYDSSGIREVIEERDTPSRFLVFEAPGKGCGHIQDKARAQ